MLLFLSLFIAGAAFANPPLRLWHGYRGGEEQAIERAAKAFTAATGTDFPPTGPSDA